MEYLERKAFLLFILGAVICPKIEAFLPFSSLSNQQDLCIRQQTSLAPAKINCRSSIHSLASDFSTLETTYLTRTSLLKKDQVTKKEISHLIFPGGGIFFYWQAGCVTYLRQNGYDLSSVRLTGASAGALTATLTACDVNFEHAANLALDMAAKAGVWDRRKGLQGIWGPMIHDWLDELLPENAVELVGISNQQSPDKVDSNAENQISSRLNILVTPLPSFGKERVTDFKDKEDLIRCNMASVHLPWFLDGKLTSEFRKKSYIDGSFLASGNDYYWQISDKECELVMSHSQDPIYAEHGLFDFVDAVSPDGIYQMMKHGQKYAKYLEERGELDFLSKIV